MSNEEHIRSDELELFALGALPLSEAAALETHLAGCSECATKLAEARGTAALLAFAAKQEQPAGTVKAELMARIRANHEAEERSAWPLKKEVEMGKGRMDADTRSSWWNWVLVPAALALAVVSFLLSWQNQRISTQLVRERHVAETLIHDRDEEEKLVSVLTAPDTITVKLAATGDAANANGLVKYNGKLGVMVYSAELPALPPDKSYQMWLVPTNGTPISAGIIGPGGHAWGKLWTAEVPANTEAKAFAVTIEPVGGVVQPTGPKVLLGAS